ncbi:FTR1 family protein [Undibacterium oligocarboniphilum]|uniref:FTR1 family protein n=1 Tax=Undibacterium oligocarboniphilum TaxID=666702 RepID=A0A850QJL7_9BURK|nr:FTR1 family protein [Undibacterium oligocarboniphilum]NVO79458.1 FTR1 family protein [Undibacterium oligocarboniphilum]
MSFLRILLFLLISFLYAVSPVIAQTTVEQDKAKQIWQLLDYLAVDYGGAVKDGKVVSAPEYAEMQEFALSAERQLGELPANAAQRDLLLQATQLRSLVAEKSAAVNVSTKARGLAGALLAAYPVPVSPGKTPDLKLGAQLFQAQCVSCHGSLGRGDGPLAASLNPPPIALTGHDRAKERSLFSLHQIITQGVKGTSMPAFAQLTDNERWALAFFASNLPYSDADREAGKKLWETNSALHASVPSLSILSQTSETALAKSLPDGQAVQVMAYLKSNPQILEQNKPDSLALSKSRLKESLAALDKGDISEASRLAISAYLDGFEPIEPALVTKNKVLFNSIEKTMGEFRAAVTAGKRDEAHTIEQQLVVQLDQAKTALQSSNSDPISTLISALTILLREGIEALLVVVAMIAFLKRAERKDVLPYVHAGWIAALAAGGLTWVAATYLVTFSGASREMTAGYSSLFAAVILLSVGIWMHQKSLAGRWQQYVKDKLSSALNKRSAVMLFLLSFVTVYREVFETVLFYAALWSDGNGGYLLIGLLVGIVILAVIAVVLLRTTARLPISQFFAVSSALVAILAFVLVGKGITALQEAGVINVTPIAIPRIDLLGIYPSTESIMAQTAILVIIIISFILNQRIGNQNRT